MAGDQENATAILSNSSGTDTSNCSGSLNKKRKARVLMPEAPVPREVNESMVELQFEKKLTRSDVEGRQHRIIIPKAYGEILFPETATRACFYFMDDMAAAKVWTFLIRSWTKGASKTYVLEGTEEYIQEHGVKEGDYIKIYKDHETSRFAIGWRKNDQDTDKSLADELKKVDSPATSSEIASDQKNGIPANSSRVAFADDYRPYFSPHDETYDSSINDVVDPEYVQKNFNMTWDEFQGFNPFDFP
ncbi:hypothetical protein ACET3Z_014277 [Daucus carota]